MRIRFTAAIALAVALPIASNAQAQESEAAGVVERGGVGELAGSSTSSTGEDAEVDRWLERMFGFYERAPFSLGYRMAMEISQQGQSVDLSAEGTLIYGSPILLRATAEMAIRMPGQSEPAAASILVVGDGETVWTQVESPAAPTQVTRMSVEEYQQISAGMGLGGIGPGDPLAQLRAMQELVDLSVVEQSAERVVLAGPLNDRFRERLGAQAQLFGPDAGVRIALDPETGAPLATEVGGAGFRIEIEFGRPVLFGPGSLPAGTFEYEPPQGVALQPPAGAGEESTERSYSGYVDRTGAVVVEPLYSTYSDFSEGLANVEIPATGREGFIDPTGRLAIAPRFRIAGSFSEGLAHAKVGGGDYGYIDRSGAWAIEPRFYDAGPFSEGLALVGTGEGKAWIDRTGEIVIGPRPYELAEPFAGGVAAFRVDSRWGLIDRTGEVVLEPRFDRIRDAVEGLAAVQEDGRWGFVDVEGRVRVEPRYEAALDFGAGLAPVRSDGTWSYVDADGEVAIRGPFELVFPFREGLATVRVSGAWGFIDPAGRMVIEPRFSEAAWFTEGLAVVQVDGRYGFIDPSGELVIEPRFERVEPFAEGLARFQETVSLSTLQLAVEEETARVAEELGRLAYAAARAEDLEQQVARFRELLDEYRPAVPFEPRFVELASSLERLAGDVGVELGITRLDEVDGAHYVEGRLALELAGTEHSIEEFLRRAPYLSRLMAPLERTEGAPGRATLATAIYWAKPPAVPEPRPCRRFSDQLGASPSSAERMAAERMAVEALEGLCDELDAAERLRRLETEEDLLVDHVGAIQDLVLATQRARSSLMDDRERELMEDLDRELTEEIERLLEEPPFEQPPPRPR